ESYVETQTRTVDFSNGALPGLAMVADEATALSEDDYHRLIAGHGYMPRGMAELRRLIADHLTQRGMETQERNILLTSGSQQALHLISECYLNAGDSVLVEDPTYRGALDAFRSAGARLHGVPCEDDGFSTEAMDDSLRLHKPRLVYVLSAVNNPTGRSTSAEKRSMLAHRARDSNVLVLDDQSTASTALAEVPPAPVGSFAPSDRVITVGSLSKDFWGGLRIGWINAAERDIDNLARVKARLDYGTSPLCKLIAARLFPRLEEARRQRREQLSRRLDDMGRLLADRLPEWSWTRPKGGTSIWVTLPRGSGSDFAQIAFRHGVSVLPGSVFSAHGHFEDHVRLTFNYEAAGLNVGVSRLAGAWLEFDRMLSTGRLDNSFL
ncbi:MAG: hypothetical protein JWN91_628, partial [Nocardioides sp.]|nr:hypothetical protein [Nocardioides sp.]